MDLSKYSSLIKPLLIIPVIVGVLIISEGFLPLQSVESTVLRKEDSFRLKTNSTTYTVYFDGASEQFSQHIYDQFKEGDKVILNHSFFKSQIKSVTKKENGLVLKNDSKEQIAIYIFAIVFMLSGLLAFNRGVLSHQIVKFAGFIVIISLIMGVRMILT